MSRTLEVVLRRSIALEHSRLTWDQITAAVRDAEGGQGYMPSEPRTCWRSMRG